MIKFDKPTMLTLRQREDAPTIYKYIPQINLFDEHVYTHFEYPIISDKIKRIISDPIRRLFNTILISYQFNAYVTHNKFIALNVELEKIEQIYDML